MFLLYVALQTSHSMLNNMRMSSRRTGSLLVQKPHNMQLDMLAMADVPDTSAKGDSTASTGKKIFPENSFRGTCSLANECQCRQQLQYKMHAELTERITAADKACYRCSTAEHMQPVLAAKPLIYAGVHAHVWQARVSVYPLCFLYYFTNS